MKTVLSRQHVNSTFEAGTYYLGDLCYVLTKTQWDELMGQVIDGGWGCRDGEFTVDGKKVFLGTTYIGDGTYLDEIGNVYCVDSGTIGICPAELMANTDKLELGKKLDIENSFMISSDNGVFIINDNHDLFKTIDTKEEYKED